MEIKVSEHVREPLRRSSAVAELLRKVLEAESEIDQDKEHFWVIGLKSNQTVKYLELVSLGTLNYTVIHPREVFRMAIMRGVSKIIAVHNHPSGFQSPSEDDRSITYQLKEAGKIIGITLLDSIIVTKQDHYSFTDAGDL